ncbi:choice-of-anchor D domain-containing protein [bacterium]|nr:choice-of-anchor D domain-containing protein [bacterium]RQV98292.1 MAG: choice-of-anchor D domain-containing protein [bacterium]
MNACYRLGFIVCFVLVLLFFATPVSAQTYALSGTVFSGDVGATSSPIPNVTMKLWGSNDAGAPSGSAVVIDFTTTDGNGWYSLSVDVGDYALDYFTIEEIDPSGYYSVGATSVSGTIVSNNLIQYNSLNLTETLTGNRFWDKPLEPDIEVYGNSSIIYDGSITPATYNGTDFGSTDVSSGTVYKTYTIKNPGGAVLSVYYAHISGGDSGDFVVTSQPGSSVSAGGTTTFTIKFDPRASGTRSTTVEISNNSLANPYDFVIQGTGTGTPNAPEMDVKGYYNYSKVSISDGDNTPSVSDGTDFGSVSVGGSSTQNFKIYNTGDLTLYLTGNPKVIIGGTHASDFSVIVQPDSVLFSGIDSTWFRVQFQPGATGLRTATLSIANNDPDENPYNFTIQGTGIAGGSGTGTIIVEKQTIPDGDSQIFTFFGHLAGSLADGAQFSYSQLTPGKYRVYEQVPQGWHLTDIDITEMISNSIIDFDSTYAELHLDSSETITVVFTNTKDSLGGASVGDRVWHDLNQNGLQDSSEFGLDSVAVSLFDNNGNLVATTQTNFSGQYLFSNVSPGSYFLRFSLKTEFTFSPPDQGMDDTIDSDAQFGSGDTPVFTVSVGDHITYMDAGMYQSDGTDIYDYGDAPDPSYPTLLTSNGARHKIVTNYHLGPSVDSESNGLPTTNADGDNNNVSNDEDGILISPFISPGQTVPITVTASSDGILNGWIDFNGNGSWSDSEDHVIPAQPVMAGANQFMINVPVSASLGQTYARFRFSSQRNLSFSGEVPDGEVEDYTIIIKESVQGSITVMKNATLKDNTPFMMCTRLSGGFFQLFCFFLQDPLNNQTVILNPSQVIDITESSTPGWALKNITITGDMDNGSTVDLTTGTVTIDFDPGEDIIIEFENEQASTGEYDFGDAPDPNYPTLLASNGARHLIDPTLCLGSIIDGEPNGLTSMVADGDNNDGSNDEDGVTLPPLLIAGQSVQVTVIASNAGTLNGWIDFNRDGDWADGGEQVIAAQSVVAGTNVISVNVPVSLVNGQSFARFRLSSVANLSYTGEAPDGEVEDYTVVLQEGGTGSLTIVKDATPKDDTPFWITTVWQWMGGAIPFRDPSSNTSTMVNGPTGNYYIGESVPSGWTLKDIVITGDTDNGSVKSVSSSSVNVDLDDGESITVIFKNEKTKEDGTSGLDAIKWYQPPLTHYIIDEDTVCYQGWRETSISQMPIVADDWFCYNPQPVTAIRWWGAYADWDTIVAPLNAPSEFHIGVWSDVPKGTDLEWSHPGHLIHQWIVERTDLGERAVYGVYHPELEESLITGFEYTYEIPMDNWFYQDGDSTIYWLTITALYDEQPEEHTWGWLTREHYFHDDAINMHFGEMPHPGIEYEIGEPIFQRWDLAYILGTEEYEQPFDFGDAPQTDYATLLVNNGAHHRILSSIHLGELVDEDDDGQPDFEALGDDQNGMDDEDGIQFTETLVPGEENEIVVQVSADGLLNGWLDIQEDGNWYEPEDHVLEEIELSAGEHTLSFFVPEDAANGETVFRFRFSREPNLWFNGFAMDGEVEDYMVMIGEETFVDQQDSRLPTAYKLHANYPNPFNPTTHILFDLPRSGEVSLTVYNIRGIKIKTLVEDFREAGSYRVIWNATNENGNTVPTGLYLCRIVTAHYQETIRMILLK